ncbi:MAG: hypothetical protein IK076_06755, partial [Bacteroidales bacterium]|nr:hypothetical protein [Bacteroidales bacterium]
LKEHEKVFNQVVSMGLDLVCLVGGEFGKVVRESACVKWFATSEDLAAWLKDNPVSRATILVKGSRGIQMEKVIPEL